MGVRPLNTATRQALFHSIQRCPKLREIQNEMTQR